MNNTMWQKILIVLAVLVALGLGAMVVLQQQQLNILTQTIMMQGEKQSPSPTTPQAVNEAAQPSTNAQVQPPATSPTAEKTPSSNIFDPSKDVAGSIVAGMTVLSAGGIPSSQLPYGTDNVLAKFMGQTTLTGTYDEGVNEMSGVEMACMTLTDPAERAKLPVLIGHPDQNTRFCFRNLSAAKAAFGSNVTSGVATVTISDYELWYAAAEVVNKATFVKVVSMTSAP